MPKRSGLGRGLDAILPTARAEATSVDGGPLREIPIGSIDPNPRQPRREFDAASIAELATSITEVGLLQPLLVRPVSAERFELIAGERRLRAARSVGLEAVPALVVETDERGSLERALVENIHREDLNPLEEAAAYKQLMEDAGLTQEGLGERLGRSQSAISNSLRLLDLPVFLQRMLTEDQLTGGHARALLALQGHPMQERAARSVVTDGLSVRATEALVRRYQEMFGSSSSKKMGRPREISAAALEAQNRLSDHLQTKVKVEASKRKRRIIIDTTSDEELNRIVEVILGDEVGGVPTTVGPGQSDSSW